MPENFYEQEKHLEQGLTGESLGRYTSKTFLLMFLGLLVTFGVAVFFSTTRAGLMTFYNAVTYIPVFHLILLIAQLAVAIGMTAAIHKITPATATVFFFLYSALTGVTFTFYFIVFELPSLILVFAATALYFGGMALFGYFTNIDLSRMRAILLGGLVFLILANLLMMFIPGLEMVDQVICTIGVVIFLAYTAYDVQKIRAFYQAYQGDAAMLKKASVFSALQLYLDFVNLFVYLLRIFGKRRN